MAGLKRPISQAGPDVKKIARQIEKALSGDRVKTVTKAAKTAQAVHNHELAKHVGSDMKMGNMGRNHRRPQGGGGRVGASIGVRPKGYAMATGVIVPKGGGTYILEDGSKPHIIRSISAGRTRAARSDIFGAGGGFGGGRKAVIKIPGVGYRKYAVQSGLPGEKAWTKGKWRARPHVTKIMRSQSSATIKRAARLGP